MRYAVTALLIAVAFASLGGCGQTGPLYMPPEPVPERQRPRPSPPHLRTAPSSQTKDP